MITVAATRFVPIEGSWMSDPAWAAKLNRDARTLDALFPAHLKGLHSSVVSRAEAAQAKALILSGSTARGRRTDISDLDYHLIGSKVDIQDLSRELDLHVLDEKKLVAEIYAGDDFVQWSLRFGLVVFDHGIVRRAHRMIATERPWPDAERKRVHAAKSVDIARRFVETGDEDGALEQVRTALSLATRAYLLKIGNFPLSRAELPEQLEACGQPKAAAALNSTIFESPTLRQLADGVDQAEWLLRRTESVRSGAEVHPIKRAASF